MRCKACDSLMGEREQYRKTLTLADGSSFSFYEDLCKKCRDFLQGDEEPDHTPNRRECYEE